MCSYARAPLRRNRFLRAVRETASYDAPKLPILLRPHAVTALQTPDAYVYAVALTFAPSPELHEFRACFPRDSLADRYAAYLPHLTFAHATTLPRARKAALASRYLDPAPAAHPHNHNHNHNHNHPVLLGPVRQPAQEVELCELRVRYGMRTITVLT